MNPNTLKLHELGQRLWLDNITPDLLAQAIVDAALLPASSPATSPAPASPTTSADEPP